MSDDPGRARFFDRWREAEVTFDLEGGRTRFLAAADARRRSPSAPSRWRLLVAAAVLVACAVTVGTFFARRTPAPDAQATRTSEALVQVWLETEATEMPLELSGGTELTIAPASRGRLETLNPDGGSFLLDRGAVRAHVVHQPHTDWRILAGPFEVQVTGTRLAVDWDPASGRFAVQVEEGAVVVRGPQLDAEQPVGQGERCVVDVHEHRRRLSRIDDDATDTRMHWKPAPTSEPSASTLPSAIAPRASRSAPVPWTTFEERGDYQGAFQAAEAAGLASLHRASTADELLRLAQVAQASGHRPAARDALLACRRRFAGSEPGAVAAYELGRASSPAEAADWFEVYLAEQPSGPLAREALGRVLEARAAAGGSAARETASRYLARYPQGPQAALARRILDEVHE